MSDYISRQVAIDAIGKLSDEMYNSTVEKGATFPPTAWFDGMAQAEHIVKNLPSAELPIKEKCCVCPHCDNCDVNEDGTITVMRDATAEERASVQKYINSISTEVIKVVRCRDCKFYGRADKRRFYRGSDCLNKRIDNIVPDRDFCSRAEKSGADMRGEET